uniref:Putative trypsin-like protein serine protease n=1 Tax=Pinctada fucata TaxID=50426 RepID=A0A194AMJ2_PINFU
MDKSKFISLLNLGLVCLIKLANGSSSLPDDSNCGVPQEAHVTDAPVKRIVNGDEAQPYKWPWAVLLEIDGLLHCGGTLVRTNNGSHVVLTAAHCVDGSFGDVARWDAKMGFITRNNALNEEHYQGHKVKQIIIHPNYLPSTLQNDIAVLILDGKVNETDGVYPACVTKAMYAAGEQCVTIGWGQVSQDNLDANSDKLQQVYKTVQSSKTCNDSFGDSFDKVTMMCAGTNKDSSGPCLSDSGGPLLCRRNQKWYLTGIVSWSFICGLTKDPPVYTNVLQYVVSGWLREVAGI